MVEIKDKSKCSGCHACVNACPKKCIDMAADEEGFLYPTVNEELCISCGLCDKACPIITPRDNGKTQGDIDCYGAYNKDLDVRRVSSSGGIFTLLAEYIIGIGGVVFGAVFDERFNVVHNGIKDKEDIFKLRGSKYVQSVIGNTYKEAKAYLEEGLPVLFTGTPCQIAGLYSYLNKDYENLVTQDFICHGVPSNIVWQKYLEYREKKSKSKIKSVSLRDKSIGWRDYSVLVTYEKKPKYKAVARKDLYMHSFLMNLCLRPSCYDCSFKTSTRDSDITLADFWGVENVMPELDDDKGTSLILVNSDKGREIFNNIKDSTVFKEVDVSLALSYNQSATKSVSQPTGRESFVKDIKTGKFDKTVNRYLKPPFFKRVKRKLLSYKKKLFG